MDAASGGDGSRILSLGLSFLSRAVLTVAMLGDGQVISHSWEKW